MLTQYSFCCVLRRRSRGLGGDNRYIIREHFALSHSGGILAVEKAVLPEVKKALEAQYNRFPLIPSSFRVILGISVPSFVLADIGQLSW